MWRHVDGIERDRRNGYDVLQWGETMSDSKRHVWVLIFAWHVIGGIWRVLA